MRKKWTGYVLAFSLFVSLLLPAEQTRAAEVTVKVTLPDFAVNLNGHKVENQYREYPLLVYHDITYFPMTWSDTRLLGLEAIWSQAAGLNIKQSEVTSSYAPYKSGIRNAATYSAKISTSAITVNGKVINNSKEQYPLLSFRNVTYFPLTWRFAHEEFGWDYKWSTASGLSISSHNLQLQTVDLPAYAAKNDVALFKGYYYFVETKDTSNHIYRAPVNRPSAKEEVYSYSHADTHTDVNSDLVGPFSFQIRENMLWFTYQIGGGVTGSKEFVKIGEDGKTVVLQLGHPYMDFRDTPYGTLIVDLGAGDVKLSLLPLGQAETKAKSVGDPELMYAYHVTQNGLTATSVVGDYVYVLCHQQMATAPNFIYKINLKTNKTEKIVDSPVRWFQIANNKLIYIKKDENNALYSSTLDGTNEMKLSEHAVSWFDSIDGKLFYTTKNKANRFELYQADPNGEDPLVSTSPVASVRVSNDKLVCQLGGSDGVVILDGSGNLLLKVADPIARVLTSDNGVLLQNSKNSTLEFIR
ncbi:DUF5050 domain-containing protein [Paenibacillus psychroresistens]|uniref:DUF5050 domain-containing protein n=1 Tax=Paenibacillus psychroresistens TaxID=1778678 RepID=A0A6B8RRN9_9BACL|nr:DUF5050 domain-containing protein [Paenibacillus psychroresistens]QGQ98056.1 DUF5050 domain-containing protein [Paenibacillus psychroresistens]